MNIHIPIWLFIFPAIGAVCIISMIIMYYGASKGWWKLPPDACP